MENGSQCECDWRFMVKWRKSISLQFYRKSVSATALLDHICSVCVHWEQSREKKAIINFSYAVSSNAIERPLPTFNQLASQI